MKLDVRQLRALWRRVKQAYPEGPFLAWNRVGRTQTGGGVRGDGGCRKDEADLGADQDGG